MNIKLEANIEFDRHQLQNAISNALFIEFTNGNHKKISEMTLYEFATYLPKIIVDEILQDTQDILIIK